MGVASGCGCKEVYSFPHITYPYSSCICSFFIAASVLFVHFLKVYIYIYINFAQVKGMYDNCGEWVECMGVASGCGE